MKFLHLTDEQLQSFLDDTITDKVDVERHLRICEHCRNVLQNYKSVYMHLEQESLPEILSEKTFEKILNTAIKSRKKESSVWETVLVTVSLIISVATSFYFFNPSPLLKKLFDAFISNISDFLNSWSAPLVRTLPILFIAVIILILFDLADRKFIKSRTTSSLLKGK